MEKLRAEVASGHFRGLYMQQQLLLHKGNGVGSVNGRWGLHAVLWGSCVVASKRTFNFIHKFHVVELDE